MSWLDKINTDFVILCGDTISEDDAGTLTVSENVKAFKPYWINASFHVEYNISEFVFNDIAGSLVKRKTPRGLQFNIEIIFQGADHLEVAKDFLTKSSFRDPNTGYAPPWRLTHPFYGYIFVQPISLTYDNTKYNQTSITGQIIETIKDNGKAFLKSDPSTVIAAKAAVISGRSAASFAADVSEPDVSNLQDLANHINSVYASVSAKINGVQRDVNRYLAAYNAANAVINRIIYDAQEIATQVQALVNTPAYFIDTVANRLNMFEAQLIIFSRDVPNITSLYNRSTSGLKKIYENNAGAAILGMCVASIANITSDYDFRPDIFRIVERILDSYNEYMINLYTLQSVNGGQVDSYIPDADTTTALSLLVNLTTSTLFSLSGSAKQERNLILPYDTNILLVADQLYGMKPDDSTVTTLIANNNINPASSELLILKKGRKIIYYV